MQSMNPLHATVVEWLLAAKRTSSASAHDAERSAHSCQILFQSAAPEKASRLNSVRVGRTNVRPPQLTLTEFRLVRNVGTNRRIVAVRIFSFDVLIRNFSVAFLILQRALAFPVHWLMQPPDGRSLRLVGGSGFPWP